MVVGHFALVGGREGSGQGEAEGEGEGLGLGFHGCWGCDVAGLDMGYSTIVYERWCLSGFSFGGCGTLFYIRGVMAVLREGSRDGVV